LSPPAASLEEFEAALAPFGDAVPDGEAFQRLCGITVEHPLAPLMAALDPFSPAYRDEAMALYRGLSRRGGGYEPARDEQSGMVMPGNPWTDLPPWSFRQTGLVAEFLLSWGQILRLMDLPEGGRVLEYGCGTGQLLLTLARAGLRAHGVDIDLSCIDAARRQAEALGLSIELDAAPFGEGFAGQRFDRIVFFESFHHAWDFEALLARLHERLAPGGRLVFCGEPIVPGPQPPVPFPWGPRLDALSIFCMRRFGWMELGFQHDFFLRLLRRSGWRTTFHPMQDCGRANAYVAEPAAPSFFRLGAARELGEGWGPPEGTHRWTEEGTADLPLPPGVGDGTGRIALQVSNPDTAAKRLVVANGPEQVAMALRPGEGERTVELGAHGAPRLSLRCERGAGGTAAADVGDGAARRRGVAVHDVELLDAPTPPLPPPPPPPLSPPVHAGTARESIKTLVRPLWRRLPEPVRASLHRLRSP
jgi:SAM-dependent methyltransferase